MRNSLGEKLRFAKSAIIQPIADFLFVLQVTKISLTIEIEG